MFRRILVPIDSPDPGLSVRYAAEMAKALGAPVTLLGVKETTSDGAPAPVDPFQWHADLAHLFAGLRSIAADMRSDGVQADAVVREGPAAERIAEYAQRNECDLVVLSRRWAVNSEDSPLRALLHLGDQSLLVIPPAAGTRVPRISRLLVPLDGSSRAECVLPVADALRQGFGAHVVLAHVVEEPSLPGQVPPSAEDMRLSRQLVERNRHAVTGLMERARDLMGSETEVRLLVRANVSSALHDLVGAEAADMVVLAAHGSAGDLRWGCGSVAHHLIEYGTRPILLIQDRRVPIVKPRVRTPVRV
jgi:nucleotide-binding universal stress UspA family protein